MVFKNLVLHHLLSIIKIRIRKYNVKSFSSGVLHENESKNKNKFSSKIFNH